MAASDWTLLWTRLSKELNLQMWEPLLNALTAEAESAYGVKVENQLAFSDGKMLSHYVAKNEFDAYLDGIFEKQVAGRNWLARVENSLDALRRAVDYAEEISSKNLREADSGKLGELFLAEWRLFITALTKRNEGIFLEERLFEKFKAELQAFLKQNGEHHKLDEYFNAILTPLKPTP